MTLKNGPTNIGSFDVPVQVLNPAKTEGNASKVIDVTFNGTYMSYDVDYQILSNLYAQSTASDCDDGHAVINVYLPQNEFITGGGYVKVNASVGTKPATPNTKANFGFNVKYNKSNTNLQGNINYIFRWKDNLNVTHLYQVKGNAMTSLSVNAENTSSRTAVFSGKCNIQEVLADGSTIPVDGTGNSVMQVLLTDAGDGKSDEYAITVWTGNGQLYHSSNWVTNQTLKLPLGGGNVVVSSSTTLPQSQSQYMVQQSDTKMQEASNNEQINISSLAYPNPTTSQFNVKLQSSNTVDPISIVVYSVNGKVVEQKQKLSAGQTIQLGALYRPGIYILDVIQGTQRKQLKLVKIPD
jgi:hypothetical protein